MGQGVLNGMEVEVTTDSSLQVAGLQEYVT